MPRTLSSHHHAQANAVSGQAPIMLLEIDHSSFAEPAKLANDSEDFPYGEAFEWQASAAYSIDDIVVPTVYNGHFYKCTVAGDSGGTEPIWPTTPPGVTVGDGTVTWAESGAQYRAVRFRATLPDDQPLQIPTAQVSIDNVGRELTDPIDASLGGRGAKISLVVGYRATPGVEELRYKMGPRDVSMDMLTITTTLTFGEMLDRLGNPHRYDPSTSPGLW